MSRNRDFRAIHPKFHFWGCKVHVKLPPKKMSRKYFQPLQKSTPQNFISNNKLPFFIALNILNNPNNMF